MLAGTGWAAPAKNLAAVLFAALAVKIKVQAKANTFMILTSRIFVS
jgi:hypothetical protein